MRLPQVNFSAELSVSSDQLSQICQGGCRFMLDGDLNALRSSKVSLARIMGRFELPAGVPLTEFALGHHLLLCSLFTEP